MYVPFLLKTLLYLIEFRYRFFFFFWSALDNSERHLGTARRDVNVAVCVLCMNTTLSKPEVYLFNTEKIPIPYSDKSKYFKETMEQFCLNAPDIHTENENLKIYHKCILHTLWGNIIVIVLAGMGREVKKCIGAQFCKICGPEWQTKCYAARYEKYQQLKPEIWSPSFLFKDMQCTVLLPKKE